MGSKKRDHSDKSQSGDERKKVREDSMSDLPDDVFEDGFNSPGCVKILVNCMRNMEQQIKELIVSSNESKQARIKGEEHLTSITTSLNFLSQKFDDLDKDLKPKDKKISELEKHLNSLEIENKTLSEMIDDQEQYSRRNCLLLHGVDEEDVEDTDQKIIKVIAEEMDIQLVEEDLDRTHRIGKKSDGKSRPIIIKFARYNVRKKIYSNKKKLKGKNVMITESLTTARVKLLKEAQSKYKSRVKNVWTTDGRIFFKVGNRISLYKR